MKLKLPLLGLLSLSEITIISCCAVAVYLTFDFYSQRILPNTTINGITVSGLTIEEAVPRLQKQSPETQETSVVLKVDDIAVASGSGELGLQYDLDAVVKEAYLRGKQGSVVQRFLTLITSVFKKTALEAKPTFDEEKATNLITQLKMRADIIGEQPRAVLKTSGNKETLEIVRGEPGRVVEPEAALEQMQRLAGENQFTILPKVASTSAALTDEQMETARQRALLFVGKKTTLTDATDIQLSATAADTDLTSLLLFPSGIQETELSELTDRWASELARPSQDAVFEYDAKTLAVTTFTPDKEGVELKKEETKEILRQVVRDIEQNNTPISSPSATAQLEQNIKKPLPIKKTKPSKPLGATNDLGITERIGYGESEYAHSIPNRIHNVKITTDRVSNTIIPAGAEFSFNKTLGEVSSRTGYRSAYVIKNGRTELGDGGGVCQVSSTVFRSVLNAGLEITKRIPHSYRVSYYELNSKPGIDATVYSGNIDFRFKNDTKHAILLHAEADSENLTMFVELYGTSDGRTTEIVDHVTWDYRSPPASEFYPDPTLPTGVKKQIDWAAAGIKAKFKNVVKDKNGVVVSEEEYVSNYKPWSAKYLVGM